MSTKESDAPPRFSVERGCTGRTLRKAGAADAADVKAVHAQVEKQHNEALRRLQHWIHQPSIAAEHRGMNEGCEFMMECCARPASVT